MLKNQTPAAPQTTTEALESRIRENPLTSVGQAAAVGFFLPLLPVGLLLGTALRIGIPILCVAGLWKAFTQVDEAESES